MSREGAGEALLAQFEKHLVLTHLSPLTIVNYLADLRALLRWGLDHWGPGFSLVTLTPDMVRAYRSHLLEEKRCAIATVNRRLQALRKFCAFAVQAGMMSSNPAEEVQLVQSEGTTPAAPLTGKQIDELLRQSDNDQSGLARRDTAILMLLLHTGLRVNELVDLRLDDVQFDHPGTHLRVRNARNGHTRQVPLEGKVRYALYEYLSVRPRVEGVAHLFLSREGRPLSTRSVQRIVSARARAAGLKGVSPQALRRTYASRLLASTGDLGLVSRRLGHQNLTTTTRFLSASMEDHA
ncbi:MAG: tyrosine-type recombinase/integrase [Anaerolineae bacterium]